MSREPRHDILFEPVRIGPKTLRNRFYQVPHCTGFGVEKPWTQAAFRGMKAEGGWAAVCTEYCSISPESDETPYVSARLWDDEDMRALSLMTAKAHEHGALAGVELWHGGVYAESRESRLPQLAPSQIASDLESVVVPKADGRATTSAAHRSEWVAAAKRARSAGFDIVYVYGSHTYLPTQFLSPVYNHRSDEYGGSFENRARFWLEAIELVKEAVGDDVAIAVRIAADTLELSGVPMDDGLAFIRAADHMVDLWDVVIGSMWGAGPARLRAVAVLRPGLPDGVVGPRPRGDRQADRGGRPVHRSRPDGRPRARRHGRPDRRGAALDLRPVPAQQDRTGPLRRDPRVHRLQRLLLALDLGQPPGLHAERDRRRGAPPRLAPGAVRPRAANADRAVLVVGAGPAGHGVRDRCSASAAWSSCTWSTPATTSAAACGGSRACRGWAAGAT